MSSVCLLALYMVLHLSMENNSVLAAEVPTVFTSSSLSVFIFLFMSLHVRDKIQFKKL